MMAAAALLLPQLTAAQGSSAAAWRDLTLADVEAAYGIIARNHPAAAVSAGDSAFRQRLESARVAAEGRVRDVASYEGWLATLRAFAVAFDDPHISVGTRLSLGTVGWPGFVVARRSDSTLVASRDTSDTDAPRTGLGAGLLRRRGSRPVRSHPARRFSRHVGCRVTVTRASSSVDEGTPLVLLTDHACFSSCLMLAALIRAVGALHVGEGTDFSTRFMEVRGFPLPSGLATFATLQKAGFGMPMRLGPYEPELPYPGRIDDTRAIEAWIASVVMGRAGPPLPSPR